MKLAMRLFAIGLFFSLSVQINAAEKSTFELGDKVNLSCTTNQKFEQSISVEIIEVVDSSLEEAVKDGAPEVFMDDLIANEYKIRKFKVTGTKPANHKGEQGGSFSFTYYGNLALPNYERNLIRTAIYRQDYGSAIVRAIAVEGSSLVKGAEPKARISLNNFDHAGGTSVRLICSGTLPGSEMVSNFSDIGEPWGRKFDCSLKARGEAEDIDFSFSVKNLHYYRLMEAVYHTDDNDAQFMISGGSNLNDHVISYLNGGDSYLLGSTERLVLIGDSDGVATSRLQLQFPTKDSTTISGKYYYKGPVHKRERWANVTCGVSEI